MLERRQLTDEHVALWREGCALLEAVGLREYDRGVSARYREFRQIDTRLTWSLIGPPSLFDACFDGPPHPYLTPSHLQFIDWPVAQTWRKA